ncbi:HAD-IIB family hydrolase [Proteobacteria bacterium 005FR1]|nr:HAD-IIB family hydrolase [Proteobacteria bacterium 005FR1]
MTDSDILREAARRLGQHWLIFTDLDGTLLDHHSYSHAPVDKTLAELERREVPVIFNTSKTFAEVSAVREELGNRHPFIVENGSAIYIPRNYFPGTVGDATRHQNYDCCLLGQPVATIHHWLNDIRRDLKVDFASFAEMSTDEIAHATNLGAEQAARAARREFSEAIQWRGTDTQKELFRRAAEAAGFTTIQGGRFIHLLGQCDKGRATLRLASEYTAQLAQAFSVVAAGDGPNDVDMLAVANLAIVVRSPAHDFPKLPAGTKAVYTGAYGPEGWAEVVDFLLAQ